MNSMTCQQEQMFKLFELTRFTYRHQGVGVGGGMDTSLK
jgi:hypothetical protein